MLDSTRLGFIDETAANTKMVQLSGRCPRGERLVGRVPHGHWKTITFVAVRHNGITAPFVFGESMTGEVFLAMSSNIWLQRSSAKTSSPWTTSRLTRSPAYERRLMLQARHFAICLNIHRT